MSLLLKIKNVFASRGFLVKHYRFIDSKRDSETGEITEINSEPKFIRVVQTNFNKKEIDGENIKVTDIQFITPGNHDIQNDDIIESNGVKYTIKIINEVAPLGEKLLYKLRARR
mgnify:CR=1 FL=1